MNSRLIWICLLIMLLIILPGSAFIGILFYPATWGFSLPLAIFVLPFIFIAVGLCSLIFIRNVANRKGMTRGVLASALVWILLCVCLITIPSTVQPFFRLSVPGLAESDLEEEGKQIASAVHAKFQAVMVSEGQSLLEMEKGRQVTASVFNGSLSISSVTMDSLPVLDSMWVTQKLRARCFPFLNENGRRVLANNPLMVKPDCSGIRVLLMEKNRVVIHSIVNVGGLGFTISKGYSILNER